jgi:predicted outer membrane repeat protein
VNPTTFRLRPIFLFALLLIGFIAVIDITAHPMSPTPPPPPGTRYVWWSATGGANNGTNWTNAFLKLEDAIAAANPGDMIWVAEGTYSPSNTVNPITGTRTYYINKSLKIYGAFKGIEISLGGRLGLAENTILEGNIPFSGGNVADHVVTVDTVSGAPGVLIDSFTIQHGNPTGGAGGKGGGIYSTGSDLDVTGCIFNENIAYYGGGIYFDAGALGLKTLHVVTSKFTDNDVETDGGAIYAQEVTGDVTNAQFELNQAKHDGGAVFLWKVPLSATLDFTNCTFWQNKATNTAGGSTSLGGAIHFGESGSGSSDISRSTVVNCTFAKNQANGCLPGQAVSVSSASVVAIYNSILYWNYTSCGSATPAIGGSPIVDWSDVENGWLPLAHNLPAGAGSDPLFRGGSPPTAGGQQLTLKGATSTSAGSPCIDRGDHTKVPPDVHDLDQDGNTTEAVPLDLLEASRMIDRHGPGEDPNQGTPAGADYLELGAYEHP